MVLNNIIVKDRENVNELTSSIKKLFDNLSIPLKEPRKIIIKPNLCYYWDSSTGQTTSPKLVSALIDYLRAEYPKKELEIVIAEADASAMKTKHAFKMLGYEKLSKEKKVRLLNLSSDPISNFSTKVNSNKCSLAFSQELLDADMIINVPKLKFHRLPMVTGAMKNIYGAIATEHKFSYHKVLSDIIVASNKIVNSNIILVDGLIALGQYPKFLNSLILGSNAFEMDCILAKIIGFNPRNVEYLSLWEREGLGKISDSEKMWNSGLSQLAKEFPKPHYFRQKISWDSQLFVLSLYAKVMGDVIPPLLLDD